MDIRSKPTFVPREHHILFSHGKTGGLGRVWVGSIDSRVKTGHKSKQVNQVAGQTGRGLSRVASWVELTRIFQFFFFFEVDATCQLFMILIGDIVTNYH